MEGRDLLNGGGSPLLSIARKDEDAFGAASSIMLLSLRETSLGKETTGTSTAFRFRGLSVLPPIVCLMCLGLNGVNGAAAEPLWPPNAPPFSLRLLSSSSWMVEAWKTGLKSRDLTSTDMGTATGLPF